MAQAASAAPPRAPETIGLLFVHGIGNQKRFDHLTQSVSEIAELMNRNAARSVNVIDRTPDWTAPVDEPSAGGVAPVTLTVIDNGSTRVFECHEVFWADLGDPHGLGNTIAFWWWALGQWCAPIYGVNDAAQLRKASVTQGGRPVSMLARLPQPFTVNFWPELLARLRLGITGLAALLTLVTWSLVKRLFAAVLKTGPSPSLIVDYVDKVRCYEDRAHPGTTALSDPGFPRRVGIRRRMIAQMVAMGARDDIDRWYVLAHSLGSVVAFNGLGEIGHTLPNYLSAAQWRALPNIFKSDPGCHLRDRSEIGLMMPARPAWLNYADVIDRKKLFANLRGFVTYGSPLEKFAAIWPRIVAVATDRLGADGQPPAPGAPVPTAFPAQCQWINLRAPLDPVAGDLPSFGATASFSGYFPQPQTYTTKFWQLYLLSHLEYFKNAEAYVNNKAMILRMQMVDWLIDPATTIKPIAPMDAKRQLGATVVAGLLVLVLAFFATAMVVAVFGVGKHLLAGAKPAASLAYGKAVFAAAPAFLCAVESWFAAVLCAALVVLLVAGLIRWVFESWSDWRLLLASNRGGGPADGVSPMTAAGRLTVMVKLQRRQFVAAAASLLVTLAVCAGAGVHLIAQGGTAYRWPVLACIALLMAVAAIVQAALNRLPGPP